MSPVLGRTETIVQSVDERDRYAGELLFRDAGEAADVDTVHLADRCFRADPERAHAAMPAEVVHVLSGVEPVFGELGFARQQAEILRPRDRGPEPRPAADRAI